MSRCSWIYGTPCITWADLPESEIGLYVSVEELIVSSDTTTPLKLVLELLRVEHFLLCLTCLHGQYRTPEMYKILRFLIMSSMEVTSLPIVAFWYEVILHLRGHHWTFLLFSMDKQLCIYCRCKRHVGQHVCVNIHVERAVYWTTEVKNILQGIIPSSTRHVFNEVVKVCAMLCYLNTKLVK